MIKYQSEFLTILEQRGFIADCTDTAGLDEILTKNAPVVTYIGFDCTAPSLHVGSLLQIMTLRWLQKSGHKPIVLMGGATTKIGDPSGKDESRQLLSDEAIAENMGGIKGIFQKFLTFGDGSTDALMVNNADWLEGIEYISFLRDYGPLLSVNKMLSRESVKLRLEREQELSFLEFNYMVMQAYDFVKLAEDYNCRLQIGGSDQWGNIVGGIELFRKAMNKQCPDSNVDKQLFGLTTPLITTASGTKMGKTADGAVWLNEDMCSAYNYWQFWRNTEDADVGRFLRMFTELPLEEIAQLETLEGAAINDAKVILANEATTLCHGETAAKEAADTAHKTFTEGGAGEALPVVEVAESRLEEGIPAFALLKEAGLAESGGAARRLIKGNGARINDTPFAAEDQPVTLADLDTDGTIKLSAGKKRHALVRVA